MSEHMRLPSGATINLDQVIATVESQCGGVNLATTYGVHLVSGDDASAMRAWSASLDTLRTEARIEGERALSDMKHGEIAVLHGLDRRVRADVRDDSFDGWIEFVDCDSGHRFIARHMVLDLPFTGVTIEEAP